MKVKTLVKFNDLKEGVTREVGEEFTCSKARFEEILKVGQFVEAVPEPQKASKKAASDE